MYILHSIILPKVYAETIKWSSAFSPIVLWATCVVHGGYDRDRGFTPVFLDFLFAVVEGFVSLVPVVVAALPEDGLELI